LAQHLSRKELKKDEVRETIAHGAEALLSHKRGTVFVLVVVIVAALAVLGWRTYSVTQTAKAAKAFRSAMQIFDAPAGSQPAVPPAPGEPSFKDDTAKYTAAAQKFEDAAKKYSRTRPGQLAGYYAGLSLEQLGKDEEARRWFESAAKGDDADYASLAQFELAKVDDKTGKTDEAAKLYDQLMAKATILVPKPVVMLALAQHYRQKNPSEAAKLYQQIKAQYPDTAIADQAGQELALLPGKS
jgi:tetratricopeptide (TPR) repeat protein